MLTLTKHQARQMREKGALLSLSVVYVNKRYGFELLSDQGRVYTLRRLQPSELLTYSTLDGAKGIVDFLKFERFGVRL